MKKDDVLRLSGFQMRTHTVEKDQTGQRSKKGMREIDRPVIATGVGGITIMQ